MNRDSSGQKLRFECLVETSGLGMGFVPHTCTALHQFPKSFQRQLIANLPGFQPGSPPACLGPYEACNYCFTPFSPCSGTEPTSSTSLFKNTSALLCTKTHRIIEESPSAGASFTCMAFKGRNLLKNTEHFLSSRPKAECKAMTCWQYLNEEVDGVGGHLADPPCPLQVCVGPTT